MTTDPAPGVFYALRNNKTGEYIRGQSQGGRLIKAPALYEARMRAHHARSMRPEVEDPADWEAVPVRVVPAEHYDELLTLALEYRAVSAYLARSDALAGDDAGARLNRLTFDRIDNVIRMVEGAQ